jgi:predicted amino acid dehydrogenase
LLPAPKGKGRVKFKAMVVGATGAIGSVCARMMARVAEEVYMVSPETAKLLALKESILLESPDAKIFLSAHADKDIGAMDMIVTATSGAGKKVLDIMRVKPGCVTRTSPVRWICRRQRSPSARMCWSSSRARSSCRATCR